MHVSTKHVEMSSLIWFNRDHHVQIDLLPFFFFCGVGKPSQLFTTAPHRHRSIKLLFFYADKTQQSVTNMVRRQLEQQTNWREKHTTIGQHNEGGSKPLSTLTHPPQNPPFALLLVSHTLSSFATK